MKYYRVNEKFGDTYLPRTGRTLIPNELYTEKEKNKYKIPSLMLDEIQVSKKSVYWFFGARFQDGTSYNSL